jgi:hypothetical protein
VKKHLFKFLIQKLLSDTKYEDLVVQIYGLTMKKTRLQGSSQLMYELPEKACVRCTVSRLYQSSPLIDCAPVCEHHQTKNNLRSLFKFLNAVFGFK